MLTVIGENSPAYPPLLKEIYGFPSRLFCLGRDLNPSDTYFAIVGTRRPSPYGRQMAEKFSSELSNAGFVIVSGLAYGIDAIAHEAALCANGKTIAVLGAGFDYITPPVNRPLALKIQENGTLITEYPADFSPRKGTFPQRNRIIAGMSVATLVIEAPQRSGALITARLALEYNRDTFAIPGNITQETSKGTNGLIRDCKALPVTCLQDIFDFLNPAWNIKNTATTQSEKSSSKFRNLTPDENTIIRLLEKSSMSIDELCKESELPIFRVTSSISLLEIKGIVTIIGSYAFITR